MSGPVAIALCVGTLFGLLIAGCVLVGFLAANRRAFAVAHDALRLARVMR